MIIGYDMFFGQNNSSIFSTVVSVGDISSMIIEKGIYDRVTMDQDTVKTYSNAQVDWAYDYVLDADFVNDLEAGNILNGGVTIEHIRFQRRLSTELTWTSITDLDYSTLITAYTFLDKYVKNGYEYEYCIVPLTASIEGERVVGANAITPAWEGMWICDLTSNYQLLHDLELGSIEHVSSTGVFEPLDSQYPIVAYSELDYRKGNVKALVLSSTTIAANAISTVAEKINRDALMLFLKNHKAKVLKSSNGMFMIISIVDNPTETFDNSYAQAIAEVDFNFVEIDDPDEDGVFLDNDLSNV